MKMKIKMMLLLCVLLYLLSEPHSFGQKEGRRITITGFVVDGTEASVANAVIMVDGKKTGNVTDRKGFYKIKVSPESRKIGVYTSTSGIVEEDISNRTRIDFRFEGSVPVQEIDGEPGEEAIDIGTGRVKRKALTAPVGTIDGTQSRYASYNSVYEMIRGEVPGVHVNGRSIMIRSATSVNMNTEPMFIVDGVPVTTIDNIQPQNVKSIQVLKGSAASVYGSRGSNGVIIINLLSAKDR
jgi:TonB-dependent SusC/RagA subfamily outer membrane receptor